MNQQCKVCGEPAAGFHFGAFTCEGCKSFFGRSYNNLSSISECKNNGECVINKKNRTSCKACRLRKCLLVGMSKSGSRYGRRSNWFKIHCLLQEQQQAASHHRQQKTPPPHHPALSMLGHPRLHQQLSAVASAMSHHQGNLHHALGRATTKEDLMLLGLDEYKNSTSPSISSPESHNSDSSVEVSDARLATRGGLFLNNKGSSDQQHVTNGISKDMFMPLPFASLASLAPVFPHSAAFLPNSATFNGTQQNPFFLSPSSYMYPQPKIPQSLLKSNNNNRYTHNNNEPNTTDVYSKRFFLDAVLQSQRSPSNGSTNRDEEDEDEDEETETEDVSSPKPPTHLSFNNDHLRKSLALPVIPLHSSVQENPMDLSMKGCRLQTSNIEDDRRSLSVGSADDNNTDQEDLEHRHIILKEEQDQDFEESSVMSNVRNLTEHRSAPMDLTTRV